MLFKNMTKRKDHLISKRIWDWPEVLAVSTSHNRTHMHAHYKTMALSFSSQRVQPIATATRLMSFLCYAPMSTSLGTRDRDANIILLLFLALPLQTVLRRITRTNETPDFHSIALSWAANFWNAPSWRLNPLPNSIINHLHVCSTTGYYFVCRVDLFICARGYQWAERL